MERGLRIIVCALLAAGLAGCGGGGAGKHIDVQAQERLREILNQDPELPDGFSARSQEAWRLPFAPGNRNCRTVLEPAGGKAPARALTAQAAASYPGTRMGEVAGVGLAQYAGAEAEDHIEALAEALEECRAVSKGAGTELHLRTLPISDVGDLVVAGQLRGRLNGYPYALNVVHVREGDTLLSVVHTGLKTVDQERTEELARSVLVMTRA